MFLTISEDGVQIHSREMSAKLNFEPLEDDPAQHHPEGIPYAPEHYNYDGGYYMTITLSSDLASMVQFHLGVPMDYVGVMLHIKE